MVVNVTTTTATVAWLVEETRATLQGPSAMTQTQPAYRVQSSTFTALQPNTHYDVTVAGEKVGFKTARQGAGDFNFILYGDTRTNPAPHKKVTDLILKQGIPDFMVFSGDTVEDARDTSQWATFFDIEHDLLRQAAVFPALGNHERHSRNYFDFFQQAKPYYTFDWGAAHFTVMDSDLGNIGNQAEQDAYWAQQTKWLEEDLKTHQNATFRFVVAHHPPYTAVTRRQGDNPHMTALVPMFEKYKVSAALFGHDHTYQHYLKDGIHYVISGGGGAPLYDVDKPPTGITQKVVSIENFVKVTVTGSTAHFKAIDINGATIEEYDIKGTPPPAK